MEQYIIELIDLLDLLDSKWRGVCVCYDHEDIKRKIQFIDEAICNYICDEPFFNEADDECFKTLSKLSTAITAPKDYRVQIFKNGVLEDCYLTGEVCSFKEKFWADSMYQKVCSLFRHINKHNINIPDSADPNNLSKHFTQQLNNFVLSDEAYREIMIERGEYIESDSIEIADVSPLENQRSITDNAVWWITKAMQSNKGVSIPDTKTAEGLKTILNKTNDKLYERRSLSRTRTEIKSLKEFLQQLLDNVPPPKD